MHQYYKAINACNEKSAHLGQLIEFDCLLKQAFVLCFKSHFTYDSSGVPGKLVYDSRLKVGGREEISVRLRIKQL